MIVYLLNNSFLVYIKCTIWQGMAAERDKKENEIIIDTSLIMLKKIEMDLMKIKENAGDGTEGAVDFYISPKKKTKKKRSGGLLFLFILMLILVFVSTVYACHKLGQI